MSKKKEKLGLFILASIVLSAMIGENMATSAGPAAQIISWTNSGVGMWFVTLIFLRLMQLKPNLTTCLYKYGEE